MLRNVLAGFLDRAEERELYVPLLFLLPELGFFDVHLIHGRAEFGKDYIAKLRQNDQLTQYVIQLKAGNITQTVFRREVLPQLTESLTIGLGHPDLDRTLPRQVILATTGELRDNAALDLQDLNEGLVRQIGALPVIFWNGQDLLEHFERVGLFPLQTAFQRDSVGSAQFLSAYGHAMNGEITPRRIEKLSRRWMEDSVKAERQRLWLAVEAVTLIQQCESTELWYEAIICQIALLRSLMHSALILPDELGFKATGEAREQLLEMCRSFVVAVEGAWNTERDLLRSTSNSLDMVPYLVQCARIGEISALRYFLEDNIEARDTTLEFLEAFALLEPGCGHVVSDRYAVSLVATVLALVHGGRPGAAMLLLRKATKWTCDRYEDQGAGLAGIEADELLETRTLLGDSLEFVDIPSVGNSFIATALGDLSAFVGDATLYRDVINDLKSCDIGFEFWGPPHSHGAYQIESDQVVHFPSLVFDDELSEMSKLGYAEHINVETATFDFTSVFGVEFAVAMALLLRDRYFPRLWPELLTR